MPVNDELRITNGESRKLPLIVGHRGASAFAPENTLAAFERAIKDDADGIELDVQTAKDGVPVVFHDPTLNRMMRRKIRVSSLTLAELQTLDIGAWFNSVHPSKSNGKYAGETVPTLAQTLDLLADYRGRIYVELKGSPDEMPTLVETVAAAIRQTNLLPNVVLKSFNLKAVTVAKKIFPELRTAALFAPKIVSMFGKQNRLIEKAQAVSADELSLHYSLATAKTLDAARRAGMPVTIWTVNRPAWVKRALQVGVHAIITNDPARLVAERERIRNSEREIERR